MYLRLLLYFGLPQCIQEFRVFGQNKDGLIVPVFFRNVELGNCGAVGHLDFIRIIQNQQPFCHVLLDQLCNVTLMVQFFLNGIHFCLDFCNFQLFFSPLLFQALLLVQMHHLAGKNENQQQD